MGEVPIHPFLVHLPIGGWLIGTLLLWIGVFRPKKEWLNAAWCCLLLGAIASIPAALTGQADIANYEGPIYIEVARHRMIGNLLPWVMIGVVLLKAHVTFRKNSKKPPEWLFGIFAGIISILVIYAGLLGGKLVYLLGVAEAILGA